MRRRARVDANHKAVTQALRAAGWYIFDTSRHSGFVDLVAAKGGRLELIEVKDGSRVPSERKLTTAERHLHAAFASAGVTVRVITTIEEAVRL